jgi:RimJ/RimL family protein N-acetyltransferase
MLTLPVLDGRHVRLEPLDRRHAAGLAEASAIDPSLYLWSPVPQGRAATAAYIETALALRNAGTAVPFAVLRASDRTVIGSTRFWDLERWPWPPDHPGYHGGGPDTCEIGYTWYGRPAIRTAANTEAKLLMLSHAFETWGVRRVCFHTDARNARSRAALARIGATFEGILRAHRLAADLVPRDSARFSIIAAEWPQLKARLAARLKAGAAGRSS